MHNMLLPLPSGVKVYRKETPFVFCPYLVHVLLDVKGKYSVCTSISYVLLAFSEFACIYLMQVSTCIR